MPRLCQVKVSDALDAICLFKTDLIDLRNGNLPPYTHEFYKKVAQALKDKWKAHDVYINLRENRRELMSKVCKEMDIEMICKKKRESTSNLCMLDASLSSEQDSSMNKNNDSLVSSFSLESGEEIFNLLIRRDLWEQMKPVMKNYNGREVLILPPGVWADIVADEFHKQYQLPCAFSFKKHTVSQRKNQQESATEIEEYPEDDNTPYITILASCKSDKCNNKLFATAKNKPITGADLWLEVKCVDTRLKPHEDIKRQLRFHKRQEIGKIVLREGAANTRRQIAKEVQNLGEFPAPILYKNDVLRKVLQEAKDKELNVDPADGTDPLLILMKLQHKTPYFGTIKHISASKFQLQYLLPEQTFVYKEYCRLFPKIRTICIDGTGSLVKKLNMTDNMQSPAIFLYKIIINFNKISVSVGQMLSASHDTINIAHWLLNWTKETKMVPKEAIADYSKALLGAMMLSFNTITLKEYVEICFSKLTSAEAKLQNRSLKTYIRVDVAHLIKIFCRLKCFAKCNKAVKDFFIRCVALMVSCEEFQKFEEILFLTLVMSKHEYDGNICNNSSSPSPAKSARLRLLELMATEEHRAFKIIPEDDNEDSEGKKIDLYPEDDPDSFINQKSEVDGELLDWLTGVQAKAELGKNLKHETANAYYMPQFNKHLFNLAKEFPLWTAVNRSCFSSQCIRPTSSYIEGFFGEMKNNILKNVHGPLRSDKFFKIDFESSKAQCLIASSEISKIRSGHPTVAENNLSSTKDVKITNQDNSIEPQEHQSIAADFISEIVPVDAPSLIDLPDFPDLTKFLPNEDLFQIENWRNKVDAEMTESDLVVSEVEQQQVFAKKKTYLQKNMSQIHGKNHHRKGPQKKQKESRQNISKSVQT